MVMWRSAPHLLTSRGAHGRSRNLLICEILNVNEVTLRNLKLDPAIVEVMNAPRRTTIHPQEARHSRYTHRTSGSRSSTPHPRALSSIMHTPGQDRSSPCPHHQDQSHPPHHQARHHVASVTATQLLAVRLLRLPRTPILTDGVRQYYFPHMTHYNFRAISQNRNLPTSDLWLTKVLVAPLLQSVSFNFPGPGTKWCQAMIS